MNSVSITIEYKLYNCGLWHLVVFSPDEYFDLEPNEKIEWDCVPFYDEAIDYLDVDQTLVQHTKITIIDIASKVTQITTSTLWNQGNSRITNVDISGSTIWRETIIDTKLNDYPATWEVLRYTRENNLSVLSYHGLFTDAEDGSQSENIIYKS